MRAVPASSTPRPTTWQLVWAVITCGFAVTLAGAPWIQVDSAAAYSAAAALTLLTAGFKVKLAPARAGASVSPATAGAVFMLLRFGAPAAAPVAMASAWIQERVRAGRPSPPMRTAFSMACVALSVMAAGLVHSGLVRYVPGLAAVGAVAAAVSAYFIVNSLLVAAVAGPARGQPPARYWRDTCLPAAPYYLLCAGAGGGAAMAADRPTDAVLVLLLGFPAYLAYRGFASYLSQLHDRQRDTERALAQGMQITEALSLAITAQHGASHDRLRQLQAYGVQLARLAGLDEPGQRAVAMAVLLRDIGLVTLPPDLRSKAGPLTPAETVELRSHPRASASILAPADLPGEVLEAIRSHHERWDGTGYPAGSTGREIPLAARIVGLLDAYDALLERQTEGQAGEVDVVFAALRLEAGRGLDPVLTGWFLDLLHGGARASPEAPSESLAGDGDFPTRDRDAVLDRIARGRRERDCMYDVAEILGSSLPLADALALVESRLRAIVGFDRWELRLSDDEGQADRGSNGGTSLPPALQPGADAGYTHETRTSAGRLAIPLEDGDECLGEIQVWRGEHRPFDDADRLALERVAGMLARKVGDARRLEAAAGTVLIDPLTGLANLRAIAQVAERELQRSAREQVPLSVVLLDIDGFAHVNAVFGHATGDRVLRMVAETLRQSVRPYDTCARVGADEFLVLLPRCPVDGALARARHLAEGISEVGLSTTRGQVRVRVDTATATYPGDGAPFASLLERAAAGLKPNVARAASSPGEAA